MATEEERGQTADSDEGKKDIGWKYNFIKDKNNKNAVTCRFCQFTSQGGINRAKRHQAGNSKDVRKCKLCLDSVREELLEHLNRKKTLKRQAAGYGKNDDAYYDYDGGEDDEEDENVEVEQISKGKRRNMSIGSGSGSNTGASNTANTKGPMDLFVRKQKAAPGKKLRQTNIRDGVDKELRDRVAQKIARFFYQAGIAFNAARLDSYREMIRAVGEYGPNLKPPSYHEIRVPFLRKEIDYTNDLMKDHIIETEKHGCSIMSDGWTDTRSRTLINILVNNAKGTRFVESIDASAHVKNGTLLFELLDKFVESLGEKNVVQVITDNGSNYVLAGKYLMAKRPHLFWTPCAAHCIDLMLEDIGKIPVIRKTIARGIAFVGFIYGHLSILHMMREFTGNKELAKYGVTRFATTFLTLQSLHKRQKDLKRMFLSVDWQQSRFAKEAKGKMANDTCFNPSFWNNVAYTLKLMGPLVVVLRIADNENRPAMGFIYEAMDRAKEAIMKTFDNNMQKCQKVLDIIDDRWNNQLHHPLHAAAYYLNPYFYYHNPNVEADAEVTSGLLKCIDRLVWEPEVREKIIFHELTVYKNAESLFGNEYAIKARNDEQQPLAPGEY